MAKDIDATDIDEILSFFNGPWSSEKVTHYCIRGRCNVCQGSRRTSLQEAKRLVRSSLGGGMTVMLLYRWKGFERANSYILRGVKQNRLLPRALALMWSAKAIRGAEQEERRVAEDGGELSFAAKQGKKAGQVLRYFEETKNATVFEEAFCGTHALQVYLNAAMAAEGAVANCTRLAATMPHGSDSQKASQKASQLNLRILSGARGQDVQHAYGAMLGTRLEAWPEQLRLGIRDVYQFRIRLLPTVADAWRRLVFAFADPRYDAFQICDMPAPPDSDGAMAMHGRQVAEVAGKLGQRKTCDRCFDDWTLGILELMQRSPLKAAYLLRCTLPILPCSSGAVERAHLVGQDTKRKRSRTHCTFAGGTYISRHGLAAWEDCT